MPYHSFMRQSAWLLVASLLLAATGGCQRPLVSATACIDPARIKPDAMCTMEYAPVCGCDGKTYANACAADRAGVRTTQPGACPGK